MALEHLIVALEFHCQLSVNEEVKVSRKSWRELKVKAEECANLSFQQSFDHQ